MPTPKKPDLPKNAKVMKRRKAVAQEALKGDINSIKLLEAFAKDTFLEHDFRTLVHVFVRLLRDATPHTSPENRASTASTQDVISAPALSALRAVYNVFVMSGVYNDSEATEWLCSEVNASQEVWTGFWDCTCDVVCRCLQSDSLNDLQEVTGYFDSLVDLFATGPPLFRQKLSLNRQVLRTFTSLWLTDRDRGQITTCLANLIQHVFTPRVFVSSLDFSMSDLGKILVDRLLHFRDAYVGNPGPNSERALLTTIYILSSLSLLEERTTEDILAAGAMAAVVSVLKTILDRIVKRASEHVSRPSLASPNMLIVVKKLVIITHFWISSGPAHISDAVQAGLFSTLVQLGIIWELNMVTNSTDLEATITKMLILLRHSLYHRRVFRQIQRQKTSYARVFNRSFQRTVPYSKQLSHFANSLEQAVAIKSTFKLRDDMHLCMNDTCPMNPTGTDVHLKECLGCRADVYCSEFCRKATWPQHRDMCRKTRMLSVSLWSTSVFLPLDVIRYHQHAVFQFISALRPEFDELYRQHSALLQSRNSATRGLARPSHMVNVDIDSQPMQLHMVPIDQLDRIRSATENVFELEPSLESLRLNGKPDSVLAYATFSLGFMRHAIVTVYE